MRICIQGPDQLTDDTLEAVIDHYKHEKAHTKVGTVNLANKLQLCILYHYAQTIIHKFYH